MKLTNEEMIKMYEDARELDFIDESHRNNGDTEYDPTPCNSQCNQCPASTACEQLSAGRYATYIVNYEKMIEQAD